MASSTSIAMSGDDSRQDPCLCRLQLSAWTGSLNVYPVPSGTELAKFSFVDVWCIVFWSGGEGGGVDTSCVGDVK